MSDTHLDDALIDAFVEGMLDTGTAVLAAEHIDQCPYCAARAAQAEPLAMAFARSPDPTPPEDFVASVLAAAECPAGKPIPRSPEVFVGGALLVVASSLMVLGDWVSAARETVMAAHATQALANAVVTAMPSALTLFPMTALTGVLCVLVVAATSRRGALDSMRERLR